MARPQFLQPALKTELVHKKEEVTAYDPTRSAAFISLNAPLEASQRSKRRTAPPEFFGVLFFCFFFPLLSLALKSSSAASDARRDVQWPRRCSLICCAQRPI